MASLKFKESLQKLSVLKTYASLIIPLMIVAIGVLILIFTWTMSKKLKGQVKRASITPGKNVSSMIETVPSQEQWKIQQRFQEDYDQDAERISLLPKESSQRQLLSYEIFPLPQGTSRAIFQDFGKNYRRSIESLVTEINARDCPTPAEINRGTGSKTRQRVGAQSSDLTDVICNSRAASISVYANPLDFSGYTFWENYEFPGVDTALADCWYWQIGYWIMEDIFTTVESMNYGSNSVLTSPVKRIMTVNFNTSSGIISTVARIPSGRSRKSKVSTPKYVASAADEFTISLTGRFTNEEFDIVHFNTSVILNANAVPRFMQELCSAKEHAFLGFSGSEEKKIFKHNLITILEMQINPIDRTASAHQLYRYGEDAVVKLDLICEYIFIKAGYDEIKPEVVKSKTKSAATVSTQ
ncbi:MAG: hypothetical protein ACYSSP_02250 [Planctomycetota bacterium]|jgi:hypothetical protein